MSLKKNLYSLNKGRTFAQNIDKAWDIYSNEQSDRSDRRVAQGFLVYAFNLKHTDNINQKIVALMHERIQYKAENPEYIPHLSPEYLDLLPAEMNLRLTDEPEKSSFPKVNELFLANELLGVNDEDKKNDLQPDTRVPYLFAHERARYRVHLYQGNFCKENKLFSTDSYVAHNKSGFGAFTINANGELSIFNHRGVAGQNAHSSMNAGSPVVCAGEICIENGKLIAINTYSGHYEPSLFNIYRALQYFTEKDVDLSEAQIYLFKDQGTKRLNMPSTEVCFQCDDGDYANFFEVSAKNFFYTFERKLDSALSSIQNDIQNYQLSFLTNILFAIKDMILRSSLTEDRKAISGELSILVSGLMGKLPEDIDSTLSELKLLVEKLQDLKSKNNDLSIRYGKDANSGRLNQQIDGFLQQAASLQVLKNREFQADELVAMKQIY